MPQKNGRKGVNRPSAPAGKGAYQHFSATCGASRFATAQAEGGLNTSADLPEMSARLLEASSQAQISAGMCGDSRMTYSAACFSLSLPRMVTCPSASIMLAPKLRNSAPTQSTASEYCPIGRAKG